MTEASTDAMPTNDTSSGTTGEDVGTTGGEPASSSGALDTTGPVVRCGSPLVDAADRLQLLDSPMRGNPDGLVTVVIWTGYADPFSRQVQATLAALRESALGDEVRVVSKQMPLPFQDPDAVFARAGLAAHELGVYWPFHDAVFALDEPDMEGIDAIAEELGLDLDVFHTTMASPEVAAQLEADQALFAAVGGQGTPSWVVNVAFNVGAQPYAVFEAAAADELEAMREAVDAGVPPCVAFEQRLDVLLP